MKFLIFIIIFTITIVFSIFNSYMFFIPYEIFSFLTLFIIIISNNVYKNSESPNKLYIIAFLLGAILDCLQNNRVFYNAFAFASILFLNDFTKNISGNKFIVGVILFIGIYDYFFYNLPILMVLFNTVLLYAFSLIAQRLLALAYVKKD